MQKRRALLVLITALVVVLVLAVLAIGAQVPTDDPQPGNVVASAVAENDEYETLANYGAFPQLRGTDLSFGTVQIPEELAPGPKLIVVSYDDDQQGIVNEWFEPLLELNTDFPRLNGYYTPLLPKDTADSAAFIIGGFAALANSAERERTIVVFTHVERFNELVAVQSTEAVQLFLLDDSHQIRWRADGAVSKAKLDTLRSVLSALDSRSAVGR